MYTASLYTGRITIVAPPPLLTLSPLGRLKLEAIEAGQPSPEFSVSAQFMELYNEEILDLLSPSGEAKGKKSNLKV